MPVLLLLTGCPRTQGPTPSDTVMGTDGSGRGSLGDDFIAGGAGSDFGLDDDLQGLGLQERDSGGGFFNGRERVEGVLEPIFFGFDQQSIRASERPKLQAAADYLGANPDMGLLIEGNTDWIGTSEYNLALGDRRARSVRDFLVTLGVSGERIEILSRGDLMATPGLSRDAAERDRRADLILLR